MRIFCAGLSLAKLIGLTKLLYELITLMNGFAVEIKGLSIWQLTNGLLKITKIKYKDLKNRKILKRSKLVKKVLKIKYSLKAFCKSLT